MSNAAPVSLTVNSTTPPPSWVEFFSVDLVKAQWPPQFVDGEGNALAPSIGPKPLVPLLPENLAPILNDIANNGVFIAACKATGVPLSTFTQWRDKYPEVRLMVEQALECYRAKVQYTISSRAIDGWEEPVFFQGIECGARRVFSDRLLEMQAKRHMPEYRDHSTTDINLKAGVLVVHAAAPSRDEYLEERRKADAQEAAGS